MRYNAALSGFHIYPVALAAVCIHVFLPDTDQCCMQSSLSIHPHRMALTATASAISVPPSVFGHKMHNRHKHNSHRVYVSKNGKSQLLQVPIDSVI